LPPFAFLGPIIGALRADSYNFR